MHPGGPACSLRGRGFGVGENGYDSQLGTVSRVPWPLSNEDFIDQGGNCVSNGPMATSIIDVPSCLLACVAQTELLNGADTEDMLELFHTYYESHST